jgi:hypothetical protein
MSKRFFEVDAACPFEYDREQYLKLDRSYSIGRLAFYANVIHLKTGELRFVDDDALVTVAQVYEENPA